jgi:predicted Zn-dependent protease
MKRKEMKTVLLETRMQTIANVINTYIVPLAKPVVSSGTVAQDPTVVAHVKETIKGEEDTVYDLYAKNKLATNGKPVPKKQFLANPARFILYGTLDEIQENQIPIGQVKANDLAAIFQKKLPKGTELSEDTLYQAVLDFTLDDLAPAEYSKQKKFTALIKRRIQEGLGDSIYNGIVDERAFGGLIKMREAFNNAAQYINNAYFYIFNQALKEAVVENEGKPLTAKQEKELEKKLLGMGLYPGVAHYGTTGAGTNQEAFDEMVDFSEREVATLKNNAEELEDLNNTETSYAKARIKTAKPISTGLREISDVQLFARRKRPVKDLGVKAYVVNTHAADSNWIQTMVEKYGVAHIFDAMLAGVDNVAEIVKFGNEQFLKQNLDFSMLEAMQRRVDTVNNLIANNEEIRAYIEKYMAETKNVSAENAVEAFLELINKPKREKDPLLLTDFNNRVEDSTKAREDLKKSISYVNQLMLPNGSYKNPDMEDILFSSPGDMRDSKILQGSETEVSATDSVKIIEEVAKRENVEISPEHETRLKTLWDDILIPLLVNTQELKTVFATATNPVNAGTYDPDNREIFIASSEGAATAGIPLSVREVAAHEYLHGTLYHFFEDPANSDYRQRAEKLYERAQEVVKPYHFLPEGVSWDMTSDSIRQAAQRRWDHIFGNPENGLHEFIAMGRTNEALIKILSDTTLGWDKGQKLSKFLESPLQFIWDAIANMLNWLTENKVRQSRGQSVYKNLDSLLQQIVQIQDKQKIGFGYKLDKIYKSTLDATNEGLKRSFYVAGRELANKAGNLAGGKFPSRLNLKGGGPEYREELVSQSKKVLGIVEEALSTNKRSELLSNLRQELFGLDATSRQWQNVLTNTLTSLEQERKRVKEGVTNLLYSFFDKNNPPSIKESRDLNDVILRLDLDSLVDNFSLEDIEQLLINPAALNEATTKLERELERTQQIPTYFRLLNEARGLGLLISEGKVGQRIQVTNADNIVEQLGFEDILPVANKERTRQIVDQLATLEGLRRTDVSKLRTTANIIARERNKAEGENGVTNLLAFHRAFKEKSLTENFDGNPVGTFKGYTKENLGTDASVEVGYASQKYEAFMRRKGYKKVRNLKRDPLHNGLQLALYKTNIEMPAYSAGAVSLTDEQQKGTTVTEQLSRAGIAIDNKYLTSKLVNDITKKMQAEAKRMSRGEVQVNEEIPYLLPIFDQKTKQIINYRYIMSLEDKDASLNRDDRVFETLGSMFSSIVDKKVTPEVNEVVLDQLKSDWDNYKDEKQTLDKSKSKYRWRFVSATSPSFEDREIYRMLPEATKFEAKKRFGDNPIPIRANLANYVFGTRDVTLTSLVTNANLVSPVTVPYAAVISFNMADKLFREVMQLVRVRNSILQPAVVTGNILSNVLVLLADGIPPAYIVEHIGTSILAMRRYQKQRDETTKLEYEVLARQQRNQNTKQLENRLGFLRNSMQKNPVHELVEEGLFTAIVEDINISGLSSQQGKIIGRLGETLEDKARGTRFSWATTTFKEMSMTPGSKSFAVATALNQYGDFVGRYIEYKYNTEVRKISKEEAKRNALEDFVFYDEPTDPRIKFMNDYGIFMYSKFFIRIQRVYAKLFAKNPAISLTTMFVDQNLADLSSISIQDYFLNFDKLWYKLDLLPVDKLLDVIGLPMLKWINPVAYAP